MAAGVIVYLSLLSGCTSVPESDSGTTTLSEEDVFRILAEKLASADERMEKKTIAVMGFDIIARPGDSYAVFATEKLTHELVNTNKLTVIERSRINKVLDEQNFSLSGAVDANIAAEIGKILAVEGVVISVINVRESEIDFIARIVQSETAAILASAAATYKTATPFVSDSAEGEQTAEKGTESGGSADTSVPDEMPVREDMSGEPEQKSAAEGKSMPQDARKVKPSEPASIVSGTITVTIDKSVYTAGQEIVVKYSGLPGSEYDWITVTESNTPDDSYGEWYYTDGKTGGTIVFGGVSSGRYEVRVYLDWPAGGYHVAARLPFAVE